MSANKWTICCLLFLSIILLGKVNCWSVNAYNVRHQGQLHRDEDPGADSAKCEKLNVSFCHGLRYNLTAMPNFMGHEDQSQAERAVSFFRVSFSPAMLFLFLFSSKTLLIYCGMVLCTPGSFTAVYTEQLIWFLRMFMGVLSAIYLYICGEKREFLFATLHFIVGLAYEGKVWHTFITFFFIRWYRYCTCKVL